MAKKLIRLTEGDLHRIVKESVQRILNEMEEGKIVNHKPYFSGEYGGTVKPGQTGYGPSYHNQFASDDEEVERAKNDKHNTRKYNVEYTNGYTWDKTGFDPLAARAQQVQMAKETGKDPSVYPHTIQGIKRHNDNSGDWPRTINSYGHSRI